MARRLDMLLIGAALSIAALTVARPAHAASETDADSGLIIAPGWELVKANCGACHSYRLITAQRGDHDFWLHTIRWMQRTQNLWQIPAAQEDAILDYLAGAYNETEWGRRPPLSPQLRP